MTLKLGETFGLRNGPKLFFPKNSPITFILATSVPLFDIFDMFDCNITSKLHLYGPPLGVLSGFRILSPLASYWPGNSHNRFQPGSMVSPSSFKST